MVSSDLMEWVRDSDPALRYLASDNLIDFAVQQGWFDPASSDKFDVQEIYGALEPNQPKVSPTHPVGYNDQGVKERELAEELAPASLPDLLAYVRDPRWSHDRSGYGQVAQLHDVKYRELNALWTAVTGAVTTPYVPIYIGAKDVPPEYKQHRYLEHKARQRLKAGHEDAAYALLTGYVNERLLDALSLGEDLVREVEHRTRDRWGIRMPTGRDLPGETMRAESQSMNRGGLPGAANSIVYCYREGIDDYPRAHGSYQRLAGDLLKKAPPEHAQSRSSLGDATAAGLGLFVAGVFMGLFARGRKQRTNR